ncbi:hypothetical protein [Ramlibacter sp.]|uniref:hypothetical protein n=1 Tax=Ramlibacter sp. TaxID=1917967 RepID=UPI002D38643D|nr:hypothetical protein [Ramlibacter sp.]HYD75814.1 hypothetical protein [Ramlibacter sp.]
MDRDVFPPLVDLGAAGFEPADAGRIAAAAAASDAPAARAALQLLDLTDHVHSFAAWCDAQAEPSHG